MWRSWKRRWSRVYIRVISRHLPVLCQHLKQKIWNRLVRRTCFGVWAFWTRRLLSRRIGRRDLTRMRWWISVLMVRLTWRICRKSIARILINRCLFWTVSRRRWRLFKIWIWIAWRVFLFWRMLRPRQFTGRGLLMVWLSWKRWSRNRDSCVFLTLEISRWVGLIWVILIWWMRPRNWNTRNWLGRIRMQTVSIWMRTEKLSMSLNEHVITPVWN